MYQTRFKLTLHTTYGYWIHIVWMKTSEAASSLKVRSSIVSEVGFTTTIDDELEDYVSLDMYFNRSMNVINLT